MTINLNFDGNSLDNYNQYTYFFQLYILRKGDNGQNEKVVFAETGGGSSSSRYPFAIEDVEIESVVSTSRSTFTGLATNLSFTVKEPRGSFFFDYIAEQARLLNKNNFIKLEFFLELTFKARGGNGTPINVKVADNTKLVYPITIINCETNISSSGSTYSFTAVRTDDLGYSDQYGVVDSSTRVTAENFQEFLDGFKVELSQKEILNLGKRRSVPNIYDFEIITNEEIDYGSYRIRSPDKNQEQPQKNASFISKTDDKKTEIHLGPNQDILRCIDFVLGNTVELKEKFSKLTNGEYDKDRAKFQDFVKQFYRVSCEVTYTEFDPLRNDWAKKFKYTIIPYKVTSVVVNPKELTSDRRVNEKKLEQINDSDFPAMIKRYDYIYTGLNDQILDFDFNLNFAWFMPVPPNDGMYSYGSTDTGKTINKNNNQQASDIREKISAEFKKALTIDDLSNIKRRVLASLPNKNTTTDSNMVGTDKSKDSEQTVGSGVEDTSDEGRSVLSSYYTQALRSGAGELVNIELQIKGDPYWLPMSSSKFNNDKATITRRQINPLLTENYFLFTVKTPAVFENESGPFKRSGVLSGVYGVHRITHTFGGGKFTQSLQAYRVPTIDLTHINKL